MDEFNGWGSSTVATKYIYLRIQAILDHESSEDMAYLLSRLSDELARAFFGDTKKKIGACISLSHRTALEMENK